MYNNLFLGIAEQSERRFKQFLPHFSKSIPKEKTMKTTAIFKKSSFFALLPLLVLLCALVLTPMASAVDATPEAENELLISGNYEDAEALAAAVTEGKTIALEGDTNLLIPMNSVFVIKTNGYVLNVATDQSDARNKAVASDNGDGTVTVAAYSDQGDRLTAMNISLSGTIKIIFYYTDLGVLSTNEAAYLEVQAPNTNGNYRVVGEYHASEFEMDTKGRYVVTVPLAAAQQTEKVRLQVVNGEERGVLRQYSIRDYADILFNSADPDHADFVQPVMNMLNYGAQAQKMFGYKTDHLANEGLYTNDAGSVSSVIEKAGTSEALAFLYGYDDTADRVESTSKGAITPVSYSVLLESDTVLRFYVNYEGEGTLTATVKRGETVLGTSAPLFRYHGPEIKNLDGKKATHYIQISNIAATKYMDLYTVEITDGSAENAATITKSVMNYVADTLTRGSADEGVLETAASLYMYYTWMTDYTVPTYTPGPAECSHENTHQVVTLAATCKAEGAYKLVCSDCGEDAGSTGAIETLAHVTKTQAAMASSCYATGLEAHQVCTLCGDCWAADADPATDDPIADKATLTIAKTSHAKANKVEKCSTGGYNNYCSLCGGITNTAINLEMTPDDIVNLIEAEPNDRLIRVEKGATKLMDETEDFEYASVKVLKNTETTEFYFYPLYSGNTDIETGQYFIMKYRLPEGMSSATEWRLYAGTSTVGADEKGRCLQTGNVFIDGDWHIVVIDLAATARDKSYVAKDADGNYTLDHVRLGLVDRAAIAEGEETGFHAFDIAYIGLCDDMTAVRNYLADKEAGNQVNRHLCAGYGDYITAKALSHSKNCAICDEATADSDFHKFDMAALTPLSDGGYTGTCTVCGKEDATALTNTHFVSGYDFHKNPYGGLVNGDDAVVPDSSDLNYIRLNSPASGYNEYSLLSVASDNPDGVKNSGQYMVIRYRVPEAASASVELWAASKQALTYSTTQTGANGEKIYSLDAGSVYISYPNWEGQRVGRNLTKGTHLSETGTWRIALIDLKNGDPNGVILNEDGTCDLRMLAFRVNAGVKLDVSFVTTVRTYEEYEYIVKALQSEGLDAGCVHSWGYTLVNEMSHINGCACGELQTGDYYKRAHTISALGCKETATGYEGICTQCHSKAFSYLAPGSLFVDGRSIGYGSPNGIAGVTYTDSNEFPYYVGQVATSGTDPHFNVSIPSGSAGTWLVMRVRNTTGKPGFQMFTSVTSTSPNEARSFHHGGSASENFQIWVFYMPNKIAEFSNDQTLKLMRIDPQASGTEFSFIALVKSVKEVQNLVEPFADECLHLATDSTTTYIDGMDCTLCSACRDVLSSKAHTHKYDNTHTSALDENNVMRDYYPCYECGEVKVFKHIHDRVSAEATAGQLYHVATCEAGCTYAEYHDNTGFAKTSATDTFYSGTCSVCNTAGISYLKPGTFFMTGMQLLENSSDITGIDPVNEATVTTSLTDPNASVKFTSSTGSGSQWVYPLKAGNAAPFNTADGPYLVVRYRKATGGDYSSTIFTDNSSPNADGKGDSFGFGVYVTAEWRVSVFKLDEKNLTAWEAGNPDPNFVRFNTYKDLEFSFFVITDSLEDIQNLMDAYSTECRHTYTDTSNPHLCLACGYKSAHSYSTSGAYADGKYALTCSVCKDVIYQTVNGVKPNYFLSATTLAGKLTHSGMQLNSVLNTEGNKEAYVTVKATGAVGDRYVTIFNDSSAVTGTYIVMKYRLSKSISDASFTIFAKATGGPAFGQPGTHADINLTVSSNYNQWQYTLLDYSGKAGLNGGTDIHNFRMDLLEGCPADTTIDIAWIAFYSTGYDAKTGYCEHNSGVTDVTFVPATSDTEAHYTMKCTNCHTVLKQSVASEATRFLTGLDIAKTMNSSGMKLKSSVKLDNTEEAYANIAYQGYVSDRAMNFFSKNTTPTGPYVVIKYRVSDAMPYDKTIPVFAWPQDMDTHKELTLNYSTATVGEWQYKFYDYSYWFTADADPTNDVFTQFRFDLFENDLGDGDISNEKIDIAWIAFYTDREAAVKASCDHDKSTRVYSSYEKVEETYNEIWTCACGIKEYRVAHEHTGSMDEAISVWDSTNNDGYIIKCRGCDEVYYKQAVSVEAVTFISAADIQRLITTQETSKDTLDTTLNEVGSGELKDITVTVSASAGGQTDQERTFKLFENNYKPQGNYIVVKFTNEVNSSRLIWRFQNGNKKGLYLGSTGGYFDTVMTDAATYRDGYKYFQKTIDLTCYNTSNETGDRDAESTDGLYMTAANLSIFWGSCTTPSMDIAWIAFFDTAEEAAAAVAGTTLSQE